MATTSFTSPVSAEGMAEIMRQVRQYRATHGVDMPQGMLNALIQGQAKAGAAESTRRAALAQDAAQFDRAQSLREDVAKKSADMQERAQDAAMLTSGLGLTYKIGKDVWKDPELRGKIKDTLGMGPGSNRDVKDALAEIKANPDAYNLGGKTGTSIAPESAPAPQQVADASPSVSTSFQDDTAGRVDALEGSILKGRKVAGAPSPAEAPAPGGYDIPQADTGLLGIDQNKDFTGAQRALGEQEFNRLSSLGSDVVDGTPAVAADGISQIEGQTYGDQVLDSMPSDGGVAGTVSPKISPTDAPVPDGPMDLASYNEFMGNDAAGNMAGEAGGLGAGAIGGGLLSGGLNAVGQLFSGGEVDAGGVGDAVLGGAAGEMAGSWAGAEIGASVGSVGGPAGMVVGAVVGGLVSTISSSLTGRVICTELNRQGLLPDAVYKLDQAYTKANLDDVVIDGYLLWARSIASGMRRSRFLTLAVKPFAESWSYTMASRMKPEEYKPRPLGTFLLWAGVPLCRFLGRHFCKRMEVSHG